MNASQDSRTRVLLISGVEAVREEVAAALGEADGQAVVHWVSEARHAENRLADLTPDMVIINDDLPASTMMDLIRGLGAGPKALPVVCLIELNRISLAGEAVLAGARSFLTKPLAKPELSKVVKVLMQQERNKRAGLPRYGARADGRVIVFCASKGGTGRTTMAVNTAVGLRHKTKKPVVLIDADYAAPALDVALNLRAERDVSDVLPRLEQMDEELMGAMLTEHSSGIKVLVASPPGVLDGPIPPEEIRAMVSILKRMFSWVIVDLGLPMNDTAYAYLDQADRIAVSVLPEMVGLRNARFVVDQFRLRDYPQEKIWLVLNRATIAAGVSQDDIESRLGLQIAYSIPDDQALATHSVNRGIPLIMSRRRSALVRVYRKFVHWVLEELPEPRVAPEPARAVRLATPIARKARQVGVWGS